MQDACLLRGSTAFAMSKLTRADGRLTWEPHGMRDGEIGGRPFSIPIGPGAEEAQEVVWIRGRIGVVFGQAASRIYEVDRVAICAGDPERPGGRRVLGYLPTDLSFGANASAQDPDQRRAATSERLQAIARGAGLGYADVRPTYGRNINKRFPGAYAQPRQAAVYSWLCPIPVVLVGASLLGGLLGLYGPDRAPAFFQVLFALVGPLFIGYGLYWWPPIQDRLLARRE